LVEYSIYLGSFQALQDGFDQEILISSVVTAISSMTGRV